MVTIIIQYISISILLVSNHIEFKELCHTGGIDSKIILLLTLAPLGSSSMSKQAKIFKELEFLGLGRYFSVRIEES